MHLQKQAELYFALAKYSSTHKKIQPPRSGTAFFVGGFSLEACFCNYDLH